MANAELATFAAGCFWGVEETFLRTPGVLSTRVGYTGGATEHPTYEDVCHHGTGHAEAVEVTFDPAVVSYGQLLRVFWDNHDPTQKNRQGPDIGDQYRSAIFVHSDAQRAEAEASLRAEAPKHAKPIATVVVSAAAFWPAEEYHQRYLRKRGLESCHI